MTTVPTTSSSPKNRLATSPDAAPTVVPAPFGLGRWLFEHRPRPLTRSTSRDEIESLVQARTAELEREIATLREEVDHRIAVERDLAHARAATETAAVAKSAFLAALSHELRAPLNGIAGTAELLRGTALNAEQTDLVQTIRQSSDWLLTIINDILDFSKIEAGRLTLEAVDFDLAEELQFAVDLHSAAALRKKLEVIVDLAPAVPARFRGDSVRIRQIVVNLLNNAVKFTQHGEITLRVRLEESLAGRSRLRFEVTDTGIGISAAAQASLFQPFVQADASTTRRFGGTGLGLAICKRLVDLMGGEIGVNSTVGAGSTFWFSIELAHPQESLEDTSLAQPSLANRHVLIVDDNATNRKMFGQLAAIWEMRPAMADSPQTALAYLREAARTLKPVEIVLLDHDIAGTDGVDLAKAILTETTIPQPILTLLSSRTKRLSQPEMDAAGIAAYERKPMHPTKLRAMLGRALRTEVLVRSEIDPTPTVGLPKADAEIRALKILVMEDNPVCQKVMVLQLRNLGCTAHLVTNGGELLAALRHRPYDIVLMNQRQPGIGDSETVRAIRAGQVAGDHGFPRELRLVAVTASALTGDRETCLAAGMDDHLSKPITYGSLHGLLTRLVGTWGANR